MSAPTDRLAALKAKLAASKPAPESASTTPALTPTASSKIETAKLSHAPATASAVEQSLLVVSDEMKALTSFDPNAFLLKLVKVHEGVQAKAPGIENYFREINKNLHQYPELVHLLNDDQLAALTSGLFFLTDTKMAEAVVTGRSKKALSINELDAMF